MTVEDLHSRPSRLEHSDYTIEIREWTPEEMHAKTVEIPRTTSFFDVTNELNKVGEYLEARGLVGRRESTPARACE